MEVKRKLSGRERDVLGQFDGDMGCFPRSATVARLHHDSTPQRNVSSWRFCPFFVRMIVRQTRREGREHEASPERPERQTIVV